MHAVTIFLDPYVLRFYQKIADLNQISLEQVLSDALFKLAGELSLESLRTNEKRKYPPS